MRKLQLLTGGESHGPGLTALLTGLPAGLRVDLDLLAHDLARRQHGHGRGRRMQIEKDTAEIRAGVRGGETLGSPLVLWIANRDYANWEKVMSPEAIDPHMAEVRRLKSPRPGHTDLAGGIKYDRRDLRDILERASARETTARVAAGAFARMLLREFGVDIKSGVRFLGPVGAGNPLPTWDDLLQLDETSPLRAIDRSLEPEMVRLVDQAKEEGDTLGGAVTVIAHNVPAGLGSHVQWDEKLDGRLAQAILSIHAVKGVEIGSGIVASQGPRSTINVRAPCSSAAGSGDGGTYSEPAYSRKPRRNASGSSVGPARHHSMPSRANASAAGLPRATAVAGGSITVSEQTF